MNCKQMVSVSHVLVLFENVLSLVQSSRGFRNCVSRYPCVGAFCEVGVSMVPRVAMEVGVIVMLHMSVISFMYI